MKHWVAIFIIAISLPVSASAEENKSFWAKLVPDNSSALDVVDKSKAFFNNLLSDTKQTGKALIEGGKDVLEYTDDTLNSLTKDD